MLQRGFSAIAELLVKMSFRRSKRSKILVPFVLLETLLSQNSLEFYPYFRNYLLNLHRTMNCSATGSTASKSEEFELTTSGHDDATSTTALAGSLVSNAAAVDVVEAVSETAAAADVADAEAHS